MTVAGILLLGLLAMSGIVYSMFEAVTVTVPQAADDSRMFTRCARGKSLKDTLNTYRLVLPERAEDVKFCDQDDWSGSAGEMQFEIDRADLVPFLESSSGGEVELVPIESSGDKGLWQTIPKGVTVDSGRYNITTATCDSTVYVDVQTVRDNVVRVYLEMVCMS
ncbi:hypothetical protein ACNPQM_30130 [Streptomyces sp. NPDC056231]|uniref:hypothetical protein n=1 Tax=Streptomyces sp. NPDC056231 TaxID=3345755 RepID=UPI003AAECFE0